MLLVLALYYLRAYARQRARGVKSGGWGAKAAVVVVAVVVGDGVVGGGAVIVAVVVRVNKNDKLGQDSAKMGQHRLNMGPTYPQDGPR